MRITGLAVRAGRGGGLGGVVLDVKRHVRVLQVAGLGGQRGRGLGGSLPVLAFAMALEAQPPDVERLGIILVVGLNAPTRSAH